MKTRSSYLITALWLCLAIYHLAFLNDETPTLEDSATYVILAQALAQWRGYTHLSYVGDPSYILAPPLFPFLLSPLVYSVGLNFTLMKGIVLFFAFASLFLIYLLIRDRAGEKKALLITSLVGISPAFFSFSHEIMADIPYLFFSLLALRFLGRYCQEKQWMSRNGLIAAGAITLAYFTRSVGFTLLLTASFALLLKSEETPIRRLFLAGIFVALCTLPALGWMVRNAAVAESVSSRSYADWFLANDEFDADEGQAGSSTHLLHRLHHNAYVYGHGVSALLFPFPRIRHNLITAGVTLLLLCGFLSHLWRRREVVEFYVALYGLILFLVPTPVVPRYLLPIFPFLLLYFLSGVETLFSFLQTRAVGTAAVTFSALLLASNVTATVFASPKKQPGLTDYREMAAWLRNYDVAANSAVLSRKPSMFYLWSGHKGALFPFTTNTQKILQVICDKQIDYVVQDSFSPVTEKYLMPTIAKNGAAFTHVYSKNDTHLFLVDRAISCQNTAHTRQATVQDVRKE